MLTGQLISVMMIYRFKGVNLNGIRRKIKNHRLNKGQTQTEYGKEFGAGKSLICQWEKGINKPNRKRLK